jgi:predicted dehydrogenase
MTQKIRFGILGLGLISSRFARVLNTVKGVELTAVASRDLVRSEKFARQFNAKKVCANYQELIIDPAVDVVYIGLTNNFHFKYVKDCLSLHKAVLCEKPLVTRQKEAEELVALAKSSQTFLMEGMWTRCMPAFQIAQTWVKDGKIGQVKMITANFCYRKPFDPDHRIFNKELEGGSLYDVGIYPIDFAIGILSDYPQSVSGSAIIAPNGVDESAAFSMHFASSALANLACGFNVKVKDGAMIYGTSGYLELDSCYRPNICRRYDENGRLIEKFHAPVKDGFVYEIRHCADLVRQGKIESDLIPLQDSIASARIFDSLNKQWGIH